MTIFESKTTEEKINTVLNEEGDSKKIEWEDVKDAGKKIQKELYDEEDEKTLDEMIKKIKKMDNIKDTEDAIGVIEKMLRGD